MENPPAKKERKPGRGAEKAGKISAAVCPRCEPLTLRIIGDWEVEVAGDSAAGGEIRTVVSVPPPVVVTVRHERYAELPEFNPQAWGGWQKGVALSAVKAQECTTCFALDPASLVVASGTGSGATIYEKGVDYAADLEWASVGRLPQGRIQPQQPVFVSYAYTEQRIDAVVLGASGNIALRSGVPHIATPLPPDLFAGENRLANIYTQGKIARLTTDNLYPILETAYPEPPGQTPSVAERLLPRTMAKLSSGGALKIVAWGDSVTDGGFLASLDTERWQAQFAARLRERFPKARLELVTEAWGGRNSSIYLAEPSGSIHNYQEKVLDAKPDLIVMEFVNDAGLHGKELDAQYGRLLRDIRGIGAEWIILTPHYIRPDWMGLTRQKGIDEDPRPYVKSLREFAARNQVALADASLRYGRLWRQGIPYNTLMKNNINHPDARGMKIFADSLMALFPKP